MLELSLKHSSYLLKSFVPMGPFYTNFMVETKDFSNSELSNHITPYYFFSSFIAIFLCKPILHFLGLTYSSIIVTALQLANTVTFLNLRKRALNTAKAVYFVSGFIFTFEMIYRFYLVNKGPGGKAVDVGYSEIQLLRAIVGSISSIVGQDIVQRTGFYEVNIHISILVQVLSLGLSLYDMTNLKSEPALIDVNMKESLLGMDSYVLCAFCAGGIASCLSFFMKLFSNILFRDKHMEIGKVNEASTPEKEPLPATGWPEYLRDTARDFVLLPIHALSAVLVFLHGLAFADYSEPGPAQRKFLSGNLDAALSVLSCAITHQISKHTPDAYKERLYILFLLLSSVFVLLMTGTRNKGVLYVMYLLVGVFSSSCSALTKRIMTTGSTDNNIIIICYLAGSVLHIAVNQACRALGTNTIVKARLYGVIGAVVFAMVLAMKLAYGEAKGQVASP